MYDEVNFYFWLFGHWLLPLKSESDETNFPREVVANYYTVKITACEKLISFERCALHRGSVEYVFIIVKII